MRKTRNSDFCYLVGYWIGDGLRTADNVGFAVRNDPRYHKNLAQKVAHVLRLRSPVRYHYTAGTSCTMNFYKETRPLLEKIKKALKDHKQLLRDPWSFLAGFLDSDGWVSYWSTPNNDPRVISICFANTNMDFLLLAMEILQKLNIPFNLNMANKKRVQEKPCWDLAISSYPGMYVTACKLLPITQDSEKVKKFKQFIKYFREVHLDQTIPICEMFPSIQGEGTNCGTLQYFVRAATCSMHCSICDSKYSWGKGTETTLREIVENVEKSQVQSVCLTGGEIAQFRNKLGALVAFLRERDIHIVLQTNGLHYAPNFQLIDTVAIDMKTPSTGEKSNESLVYKLRPQDEVKSLICTREDYEHAIKINQKVARVGCKHILQPLNLVGRDTTKSLLEKYKWICEMVIHDGRWTNVHVIPQLHVLLWGNRRGK